MSDLDAEMLRVYRGYTRLDLLREIAHIHNEVLLTADRLALLNSESCLATLEGRARSAGGLTFALWNLPGCYALIKGVNVVYVGTSTSVLRRVSEHRSRAENGLGRKDFDCAVAIYIEDGPERLRWERETIAALNPPLNRMGVSDIGRRLSAIRARKQKQQQKEKDHLP